MRPTSDGYVLTSGVIFQTLTSARKVLTSATKRWPNVPTPSELTSASASRATGVLAWRTIVKVRLNNGRPWPVPQSHLFAGGDRVRVIDLPQMLPRSKIS